MVHVLEGSSCLAHSQCVAAHQHHTLSGNAGVGEAWLALVMVGVVRPVSTLNLASR